MREITLFQLSNRKITRQDQDQYQDPFIGPQEFVVGYSKAPKQPQSNAWPICHSHAMTRKGRKPASIRIAAYWSSPRYAQHYGRQHASKVTCLRQMVCQLAMVWFKHILFHHTLKMPQRFFQNSGLWGHVKKNMHIIYHPLLQCKVSIWVGGMTPRAFTVDENKM